MVPLLIYVDVLDSLNWQSLWECMESGAGPERPLQFAARRRLATEEYKEVGPDAKLARRGGKISVIRHRPLRALRGS